MKEEKSNNNKEKPIMPEEISKIDPFTISKIILLDGTVLVVQNSSINKGNQKNHYQNLDIGAAINLKSNQIQNSSKKQKNKSSYIEWDFPQSKYRNNSYQRNIGNDLMESKTEQNENSNTIKNNSRESAINRNIRNKNYSYYESKHTKKKSNNNSDIELKNTSGFCKKEEKNNFKEINNKENKENKEKENNDLVNKNNNNNNQENLEEIKNINNNENNNKNNKNNIKENDNNNNNNNIIKEKKEEISNKKTNKDNLSFNEKIKLIKYGLFDYDYDFNSTGLKNEENNIQKINKVRPLNIIIDKTKNKNDDDINIQFNKLLNKFNENKNSNKKLYETNKIYGKDNNLNEDINKLNNLIHKNKFNYTYNNLNKNENNNGNSYKDLNERINQLKKKSLNGNLVNTFPSKTIYGQRSKLLVLPSNFK